MNELTLSSLLGILKKCLVYMIVVSVLCAIGAYCYCKFIATPTYQTSISFIGANSSGFGIQTDEDDDHFDSTDISVSRALILTYVDMFKTNGFYEMIQEKCGLDYSAGRIRGMVNVVQRAENSLFIDVTVTCSNPKHAIKIAETIYEYGDDYLSGTFPIAYVKAIEGTNSTATQNYPVTSTTMMAAVILGAVLVFGIAVIITVMDKTIKGEKDFVANYDIPILGNIPNFKAAAREEKK